MDSTKSTGLPRPRPVSKLPAPRSLPQPTHRPSIASPIASQNNGLQQNVSVTTTRQAPVLDPARNRNSVAVYPTRAPPTSAEQKHSARQSVASFNLQKQPFEPSPRPQPARRPQSVMYGSMASRASAKQNKTLSQQENIVHEQITSGEESFSKPETREPATPIGVKKARPSLSERTIESLSHTPASTRRRSSFFGAQSPTSPSTVIENTPKVSSLNYGRKPSNSFIRPPSPSKRPVSSYGRPASPIKTSTSTFGRPASPNKRPLTGYGNAPPRKGSVVATTRNPVPSRPTVGVIKPAAIQQDSVGHPAPKKAVDGRPTSRTHLKDSGIDVDQVYVATHPPGVSPRKVSIRSTNSEDAYLEEIRRESKEVKEEPKSSPTSAASASLREQIAKAKAAARAALKKEKLSPIKPVASDYNFESIDDPFNTKPKDGKETLRKRIDDGRRDGRLNVSGLGLKEVPDEILKMYDSSAIQAADLSYNDVTDLTRFNAADNEICDICDGVFPDGGSQFAGLEILDFHGNSIPRIPLGLRRLERLSTLNLSRNKLDNWCFDIIAQVPTLQHLHLANNELTYELPESIGALTSLETLSLENNKLTTIPASIERLTNLRVLHISNNRLSSLHIEALAKIPNLTDISASSNSIVGALFPSSVTGLPNLKSLDVAHNAIASLAFGVASRTSLMLPALIRLDVSANRIGSFPDISNWTNLAVLTAEENALSDVPTGMTNLRENLRSVNLERNELRSIDVNIAHMKALENLQLGGNPLRAERKLLTMGAAQIKNELSRKLEADPTA